MRTRILTTLLVAALAAGCGADEESEPSIPADSAAALEAQLNSIQDRFEFPGGEACGDITGGSDPNTQAVNTLIASLPQSVDGDVRTALEQSFARLFELVERECAEAEQNDTTPETETQTETTQTTTETEPTDTTETEPPTTDTTETEPPPTETLPPTEPTTPPDGDGGGGFGPEEGL